MKKYMVLFITGALCLALAACGKGTYFPSSDAMQKNLEAAGYTVAVTDDLEGGLAGTHLSAVKGGDYLEFYWLDNGGSVESLSHELKAAYPDHETFVSMEDDEKFGSLIFCGTSRAAADAKIEIVDAAGTDLDVG